MAKWFLRNHDFIHVNSSVAAKYNKHKQDGSRLGIPIRMILATVDLQVTVILPMNFESIVLSVQEKKFKTDFKMAAMAAIWDFLSQQFELFFIYKSPWCFLPSFESVGLSVQKKKGKIYFQMAAIFISTSHPHASYLFSNQLALWFRKISEKKSFKTSWISDPNNLSYFRSPQCFLPSFESVSVREKKRKIDFQDGCHGGHLGFLIGTILAIFDLQVTLMLPT